MKRCAVFSCMGLGDGLIALVLSNNLHLNGFSVTTFHPFLGEMQDWFPHLPLKKFPAAEENLEGLLKSFDHFFIIYEKSTWMQRVLAYCEKHFPKKTLVLNPIATPNRDYPYWENGRFDGNRPFVDNLYVLCKDLLKLPVITKSNGIMPLEHVQPRRYSRRVVIHPTSSRAGKNWPQEKYSKLSGRLKAKGYDPVLILTQEERLSWQAEGNTAPLFANLSQMAEYICESALMIGNDSGIGHLASCLGLPTVTICRNVQTARFWRPAWSVGKVLAPSPWVPNLKGLRLRDRHWKKWISVKKVLKTFSELESVCDFG